MNLVTDAPRQGRLRIAVMVIRGAVMLVCFIGIFLLINFVTPQASLLLGPSDVFFCTPPLYAGTILIFAAIGLSASILSIGGILINLLLWIALPIRSALWRSKRSFIRSQSQLAKFALYISLFVIPIYLIVLSSHVCLSDSTIHYQPNIFSSSRTYRISQIAEVRPGCAKGSRGGWGIRLEIAMTDATLFDLAFLGTPLFGSSSEHILALLRNAPLDTSQIHHDCPIGLRRLITP